MRPQLFAGGVLVALMGVLFYLVVLPVTYFWGIPFVVAGTIMAMASFFLSETQGPVTAPEGFKFCLFCSTPMPMKAGRCPHCNGLQPREGS
jgi:hypothetical protein